MTWAASHALTRALYTDSDNVDFDDPGIRESEPTVDVQVAGLGGTEAPERLLLIPFGDGTLGSAFKLRLYGWYHVGPSKDANKVTWLPLVLAELRCVLGDKNGLASRLVEPKERFAREISLLLGDGGGIVNGPIAWAKVDLHGCRKFSFDFAQDGTLAGALGNCLWSPASAF